MRQEKKEARREGGGEKRVTEGRRIGKEGGREGRKEKEKDEERD